MKISEAVQIFALAAFLIICGTLNNTAEAAEREIEIYNNTGYTIERLYISPIHMSGVSYWDLLGDRILYNSDHTTVEVADGYQKINPITATFKIVGHNSTVDYDGQAQGEDYIKIITLTKQINFFTRRLYILQSPLNFFLRL